MKIQVISFDTTAVIPENYSELIRDKKSFEVIDEHNEELLRDILKDKHDYELHCVMLPDSEVLLDPEKNNIVYDFALCYQHSLNEPKKYLPIEYEPVISRMDNVDLLTRSLYIQIHQLAKKYPEAEITFVMCYGPKNEELFSYFKENLRLLPDNIEIKIPGKEAHNDCRGKGLINPFPEEHININLISILDERKNFPDLDENLKALENSLLQTDNQKQKYIIRSIAMIVQQKYKDLGNNPEFGKFLDSVQRLIKLKVNEQEQIHFNTLLEQSMLIFKLVGYGTTMSRFFNDDERILHLNWLLYVNQLLQGMSSYIEEREPAYLIQVHNALIKLNNYKNQQLLVTACAFIVGGLLALTPAVSIILCHLLYSSALLAIGCVVLGIPLYVAGLATFGKGFAAHSIAKDQGALVASLKDVENYFNDVENKDSNTLIPV